MKVLEYNLVSPVFDTSKMMQVGEFSTKVIVGLTKYEEEYICKAIDEGLDIDVLHDVIKKLNIVIRLYVNKQYIISHPNNTNSIVRVSFKVETIEEISRHMYEANDESIVTTWLDLHNKRPKEILAPVMKQESNHQRTPKRNYRMVGERTKPTVPEEPSESSNTSWIAYVLAAIALIALGILLFASIGLAVFFLPLLAGAFAKK